MSLKPKRKKYRNKGNGEEAEEVSLNCLSLHGRGGGCKVSADISEVFGDPCIRRRSSTIKEVKRSTMICGNEEATVDCFSYGMKEKIWKRNNKSLLGYEETQQNSGMSVHLPDEILEMCLVRLPFGSLMNVRLVCRKWKHLTTTPRFMQMRREGLFRTPWLFLFGIVKNGYCSGEIHALDVNLKQWHKIDARILKGRFLFSVASIEDNVYIVGGRSSTATFGKVDGSSFKTHRGVLVFSPLTTSWSRAAPMKYARSSSILGISEVSPDCSVIRHRQSRQDRHFNTSRIAGVSEVYEDPHGLSLRRQSGYPLEENHTSALHNNRPSQKTEKSHSKVGRNFVLIAVGGLGSWDEPLDSGEIYDFVSNKWIEIQRLPLDFGVACSGVVFDNMFYVYSESDKLAAYDIERGYWVRIQTTPCPPRVHEYYPKLISCKSRLIMISVSWCEGDGRIGRRNKAVRKLWELDLTYLSWKEVSIHPDAPMDWNAAFVADENLIFGVEMFKIFGQVLDFVTMCNLSDMGTTWTHISRNHVARERDTLSCMTKSLVALRL